MVLWNILKLTFLYLYNKKRDVECFFLHAMNGNFDWNCFRMIYYMMSEKVNRTSFETVLWIEMYTAGKQKGTNQRVVVAVVDSSSGMGSGDSVPTDFQTGNGRDSSSLPEHLVSGLLSLCWHRLMSVLFRERVTRSCQEIQVLQSDRLQMLQIRQQLPDFLYTQLQHLLYNKTFDPPSLIQQVQEPFYETVNSAFPVRKLFYKILCSLNSYQFL